MSTQHTPGPRLTAGALWHVASYAHDRRAHRHRCRHCRRIVQAGEAVWMARVADRTTKVIHAKPCADAVVPFENPMTALELLACHAVGYANAMIYNQLNDAMLLAAGRRDIAKVAAGHCDQCGGSGEIFGHAEDCEDDLCALNGDEHSCAGQVAPCACAAIAKATGSAN